MKSDYPLMREVADLTLHLMNGTQDEQKRRDLEALLESNPLALEYYVELIWIYVGLNSMEGISCLQGGDRLEFSPALLDALLEQEKSAPAIQRVVATAEVHPPAPQRAEAPNRVNRFWRVMALVSSAALVFLVLYACVNAWLLPREVATVAGSIKAQWDAPGASMDVGQRLSTKTPLRLKSGFAELVFDAGVKVVVEAPAVLELCSEDRMWLQAGRITALVSQPAQGFRVDTPTSRVTDLGTEFGVQVSRRGDAVVQMYQGRARLALKSARRQDLVIHKGQARHVNTAGTMVTEVPFETRAFVTTRDFVAMRDPPPAGPPKEDALARHPALCIHLDASRASTLTIGGGGAVSAWANIVAGPSAYRAVLQKGAAVYVPDALGPGLGAVDFGNPDLARGEAGTQMRLMTQAESKIFLDQTGPVAAGFTVALVVRAQSPAAEDWCNLIGNTSVVEVPGFFVRWHIVKGQPTAAAFLGGRTVRQDCAFIDTTVVLVCCYERGTQTLSLWNSNSNETSRKTVPPGDFTVSGDTELANDVDHNLNLGAFGRTKSRYFDGWIGEVRIYRQALKTEDLIALKDELVCKWNVKVPAL